MTRKSERRSAAVALGRLQRTAVRMPAKPPRAHLGAQVLPRQRLDPADRAKTIATAAARLFADKGFEGRPANSRRAFGVTQPLLYRYFPSKDALIERACRDIFLDR